MTVMFYRPVPYLIASVLALLASEPALATGGEHVVDHATVETPGSCHLESWVTTHGDGRGLLNLSPACTRRTWPQLEIGASFQHSWDGVDLTTFGPALKLNLRPVERGVGSHSSPRARSICVRAGSRPQA